MHRSLYLLLQSSGAPIPELDKVEAAVEDRGGLDPAQLTVDAGRCGAMVAAAGSQVVAVGAADGVVAGEACVVEQEIPQRDLVGIQIDR